MNATVATSIIARRWADALRSSTSQSRGVLLLDACYKAVAFSVRSICEPAGGQLHFSPVPFPGTTPELVLRSLDETLQRTQPRFALLDHITSQPALVLPVTEMVALCRNHGVEEIAIDAAHAVGMLAADEVDAPHIGADFYYTKCARALCDPPDGLMN